MTRIIPPANGRLQQGNPWQQARQDDPYELSDSDLSQDDSYYVPSTPFAQKLTSLDPALYQGSGEDFCNIDNFDQTSAFVNHQLGIHGFMANLQFLKGDKQNASRVVSALYKVLQQHQKDIQYKEEMDLNWRRLSNDYDTAVQNLNHTRAQLEKSERETDLLSGRIGAMEDELRVETEKHRHTRDELKSSKANLQYTKTQFAHESRKKEQEMHVLKEKVQKSINRTTNSSASTSIPGGITVLNPVPRSLYGRHNTNETEQLLQEVIEQQQGKENEIVEENEQLRRTLYTVHMELEGLLRKHANTKNAPNNAYGLPYEMVKDKIETEIRDTLTVLSDQWAHRPSQDPVISPNDIVIRDQMIADLQKQIEKLRLELEDSTLLVQGAQKMIDNMTGGNFMAGLQDFKLNLEGSDMTLQEIEDVEAEIIQQREQLAKERKRFTEACLDLGKQREELQRAKAEFEEGKRTFTLDNFMSLLSSSPTPNVPAAEKRTFEKSPPLSPTHRAEPTTWSRKRVATSPLPPIFGQPEGRAVRPKTQLRTTMLEVPDNDNSQFVPSLSTTKTNTNSFLDRRQPSGGQNQGSRYNDRLHQDEQEDEEDEPLLRTPTRARTTVFPITMDLNRVSQMNKEANERANAVAKSPFAKRTNLFSSATGAGGTEATSAPSISVARASTPTSFASPGRSSRLDGILGSSTADTTAATSTSAAQPRPTTPSSLTSKFVWDAKDQSFSKYKVPSPFNDFAVPTSKSSYLSFHSDKAQTSARDNVASRDNSAAEMSDTSEREEAPSLVQAAKMPSALSRAAALLASRKSTTSRPPSRTSASTSFSLESRAIGGGGNRSSDYTSTFSVPDPIVRSTTPSQSPPSQPTQQQQQPQQPQQEQHRQTFSSAGRSGPAGTGLVATSSSSSASATAKTFPAPSSHSTGPASRTGVRTGSGAPGARIAASSRTRVAATTVNRTAAARSAHPPSRQQQQRQAPPPKGPAIGRDLAQSQLQAQHLYAANRQTFLTARKP